MKNQHLEESDWKHLRKLAIECRERYVGDVNLRLSQVLTGEGADSATERFWRAGEEIDKEAVILRDCLDDQRRSNAFRKAASMYHHGIIKEGDLEGFTEEFVERIKLMAEI